MKKITSLILALFMSFATMVYGEEPVGYTDITKDDKLFPAVLRLGELDIMTGFSDGTFGADKTITRAEMAALIIHLRNLSEAASAAKGDAFIDVPSTYWASGYIMLSKQIGAINGYEDGTFRPEEEVTYEQAVKMIVSALGYMPKAEAIGGYPVGYLLTASQAGLVRGATGVSGESITRRTVAQLLHNSLNCPIMEQIGFSKEAPEYAIMDGSNGSSLKTIETPYHLQSTCYFLDYKNRVILSDQDIVSVTADAETKGGYYYIDFELNEIAKERFAAATEEIATYPEGSNILKFVYNLKIIALPRITEKITAGHIRITGEFDKAFAEGIVAEINESLKPSK